MGDIRFTEMPAMGFLRLSGSPLGKGRVQSPAWANLSA
jgi:hypothetical protein